MQACNDNNAQCYVICHIKFICIPQCPHAKCISVGGFLPNKDLVDFSLTWTNNLQCRLWQYLFFLVSGLVEYKLQVKQAAKCSHEFMWNIFWLSSSSSKQFCNHYDPRSVPLIGNVASRNVYWNKHLHGVSSDYHWTLLSLVSQYCSGHCNYYLKEQVFLAVPSDLVIFNVKETMKTYFDSHKIANNRYRHSYFVNKH